MKIVSKMKWVYWLAAFVFAIGAFVPSTVSIAVADEEEQIDETDDDSGYDELAELEACLEELENLDTEDL